MWGITLSSGSFYSILASLYVEKDPAILDHWYAETFHEIKLITLT